MDGQVIIALASLLGCLAMALGCAAHLAAMVATLRPVTAPPQPWEIRTPVRYAQSQPDSWYTSPHAPVFAR